MRFVVNPFTDLLDAIAASGSGGGPVGTLTGNDGIVVPPDGSGNIDVLGNNSQGINITGNAGTNTLTVAGINASTSQIGVLATATNGQASAQSSTSVALTPSNITSLFSANPLPASQGGTGIASPTLHSLIVGGGATSYTQLGVATNGQLPIGSTGADPVLANITSLNSSVTVTNGAGSIDLAVASTPLSIGAFGSTPNADGLTLTGNVLNMQPADGTHPGGVSTTSQTFGGAKNFALSASSPIFAVLSGGGGTSQIQYPASAANYNFNLPSTAGTSGQFLTSGGGASSPMTWTTGSFFTWVEVTGTSQAMAVNTGYIANNAGLVTMTLPTTSAVGDTIIVHGKGAGGWTVTYTTSQLIHVGSSASTITTGNIASSNQWDALTLTCMTANTIWAARGVQGNLTIV